MILLRTIFEVWENVSLSFLAVELSRRVSHREMWGLTVAKDGQRMVTLLMPDWCERLL